MFKLSHAVCIGIAGLLWLGVGLFLLPLGLKLIMTASQSPPEITYPIVSNLASFTGGADQAALILIAFCLLVGYFKSRYVLSKSVQRVVNRILSLPAPIAIHSIYNWQFYLLIGIMISLGMLIKYFNVIADVRGAIDVAIGAALINGSMLYFRTAIAVHRSDAEISQRFP